MPARAAASRHAVALRWLPAVAAIAAACASTDPAPSPPLLPMAPVADRAIVDRDGLRVTVTIEAPPLEIGTPHTVTVTIENRRPDLVLYGTDDCGFLADVSYRSTRDWAAVGVAQVGPAAEFKTMALRGETPTGPGGRRWLTPALFVGVESWGCGDALLPHSLQIGASVQQQWQWDNSPEATGGPILMEAMVRSLGSADESAAGHDEPIRVELESAVVGGFAPDELGPIGAVDAALADEAFAVFLASAPREAWRTATLLLDEERRFWRVRLTVDRGAVAPDAYGEVTVDGWTGLVVGRRFEPPFG
jgi:hypothetical protein